MEEIINFNYRPELRTLIVNYVLRMYEENNITDDEHLIAEFNFLKRNNQLHFLFEEEYLINILKDDNNNR